jgi:tRNA dimethylallyltransferase
VEQQRVLVIVGPTAVGKTELSLQLAERLGGEIISADSMQVYRGMDIGTAKATHVERQRVRHHLLDVVEPDQAFNVADYVALAENALAELAQRGVTPVITGGTGLYIDALLKGFLFPDTSADPIIRAELEAQAELDPSSLFAELEKVDPVSAERIHPNDKRRIIRALEVYRRTGEPISKLQHKAAEQDRPYRPLYIGLSRNRQELYERINRRVEIMIEDGLIDEVKELLMRYPEQPTALQALGYKEIAWYLNGRLQLTEAIELLQRDTRRYAKRQLSWFKRNKDIKWFNLSKLSGQEVMARIIEQWEIH